MSEIQINSIPAKLIRGGKQRNKDSLSRLAQYNCRLAPAAEILSDLGLNFDDMAFLNSLGLMCNGWHPIMVSPVSIPGNQARLAELGLILLNKKHQISLSDAGRFLLVLSSFTAG